MTLKEKRDRVEKIQAAIIGEEKYADIAVKFGLTPARVSMIATSIGIHRQPIRIKGRFDGVDWSMRDADIARAVGCSGEYVRQYRLKLQKPKVIRRQKLISSESWMRSYLSPTRQGAPLTCSYSGRPSDYEKLWNELETLYFLPLSRGMFSVIDAMDAPRLSHRKWTMAGGYAFRFEGRRPDGSRNRINLHHLILPPLPGKFIDHKNGIRSDNRRCNLRHATHSQNVQNQPAKARSGFKGVYLRQNNYYEVVLRINGKVTFVGHADDPMEAAKIYDFHALRTQGEFARLNFPELRSQYEAQLKQSPAFDPSRLLEAFSKTA